MKYIISVIIALSLSSCVMVKTTQYKELSESEKYNLRPRKINLSYHQNQNNGIYSINSEEFIALLDKTPKKYKMLILNNGTCGWYQPVLKDLTNWSSDNIELFTVSGHDWGLKDYYDEYFEENKYLEKIYLVDAEKYAEIEGWYDNDIHRNRLKKFVNESIEDDDSEMKQEIVDREFLPDAIIFDPNNKIIKYYSNLDCETSEECLENHKEFLKYIDKL